MLYNIRTMDMFQSPTVADRKREIYVFYCEAYALIQQW